MLEITRLADLLVEAFDGKPYYGPSLRDTLRTVRAEVAATQPDDGSHSIWELVAHLTAELDYTRRMIEGVAGDWVEGQTTWPPITETSPTSWDQTIAGLERANQDLVSLVRGLDDAALLTETAPMRIPIYVALYGTLQHHAYHAGQIALLARMSRG